jgi:parvulin-like peptidyl-prolyl isomerase
VVRPPRNAIVVVALVLLAGCGGKKGNLDKVIARAGDIEVTLGDFSDAWQQITEVNRPDISSLEQKRRFANDLLNQRILLAEARRVIGTLEAQGQAAIERRREAEILKALHHLEVETKVDVQGAEVEELYRRRATNVKASHILLNDLETAQRVRDEIVSGKISFEDAARKYSLDQASRNAGGLLGEIAWAQTLADFQSRAFEMPVGEVSEPFETRFGFHVLRVEAHVPKEQPPLEEARVVLRNEVRRQKEQARSRELTDALAEKAGLAWNEEGIDLLLAGIERMTQAEPDTLDDEHRFVPPVGEEEQKVALATFAGRTWTIADYLAALKEEPPQNRPPGLIPRNGLKELIRVRQLGPQIALVEAEARKLGDDPVIRKRLERMEEQFLIEKFHARFIQSVDVTPEEVKAFYDSTAAANPDGLLLPERVDMRVIAHTSADSVKKALGRIAKGEDEVAVVKAVTYDLRSSYQGSTGLLARGTYPPQVDEIAFSDRAGTGWNGPIQTEHGVIAFRVVGREKSRPARLEEVEGRLTQALAEARGEKAFEEWLTKERETRNVQIFDDALELYAQAVTAPGAAAAPGTAGT